MQSDIKKIEEDAKAFVEADYQKALLEEDPRPEDLLLHDFAPTPITEEKGNRAPSGKEKTVMVDSALFAIREIMDKTSKCFVIRTRCWRTFRRCI